MSEREEFLLVLGLIYLAECLRWVRRGGVVFRRVLGPRWFRQDYSEFLANDRGDLHWTWPFPDLGEFLVARGIPWSLGPLGVATWHPASRHPQGRTSQTLHFRSWDELQVIEVDAQKITVGGRPWWIADTPVEANRLTAMMRRLVKLEPNARAAAITAELNSTFNVRSIQGRIECTRVGLKSLRGLANGLFLLLFGVGPAAVWRFGWLPVLPLVLAGVYVASGWIAWLTVRRHRDWYPEVPEERFKLGLLAALSPVTAIRSGDILGRCRVENFEPMAVALALFPTAIAAAWVAAWARDAHYPRLPENPFPVATSGAETVVWFTEQYRQAGDAAIRAAGLNPALGHQPPAQTERVHTQYCPRCQAQFQVSAIACQSCGGRALLPLPQSRPLP